MENTELRAMHVSDAMYLHRCRCFISVLGGPCRGSRLEGLCSGAVCCCREVDAVEIHLSLKKAQWRD